VNELILKGIDGANPLGFLAAVGTVVLYTKCDPTASLRWSIDQGSWRPIVRISDCDEDEFVCRLSSALSNSSSEPFDHQAKLPFLAAKFAEIVKESAKASTREDRRTADLMAAFGNEVCTDKEVFKDTLFRMVRSGDAAGQGMPYYANSIRKQTDSECIRRTLFTFWDYMDHSYSLRWDPMEDQRYALRWHDPSKNKDTYSPGVMNGANALSLEALSLFPTAPVGYDLATTGFFEDPTKRIFFTWPIWDVPVSLGTIRSLISLRILHTEKPPRDKLSAMGIAEIYRCERIAPNKYYKNFSISFPA
jgi:hypothetical protein